MVNIVVLDTTFNVVGILDFYESIIWTDRYNAYGDFELYIPASSDVLELLRLDYYLTIKESEHVMIIEKIKIDTDNDSGDYITVSGRSLESILDRRIVWNQTTVSGNLQNAIKKLINDSIIAPTNSSRKISNFIFNVATDKSVADLKIDQTMFTGDDLYDVVQNFCSVFDIGFKIILNAQNQFVFSLYSGTDRSYSQSTNPYVVYSPSFDNLLSSNHVSDYTNYKNVALIGGEGEGPARRYTTTGSGSNLERRELFVDARDITSEITNDDGSTTKLSNSQYLQCLVERGNSQMESYVKEETFDGQIDDNGLYKINQDFFNGDIVQLINEYGLSNPTRVVEITISEDESGYSIYPTFETIN